MDLNSLIDTIKRSIVTGTSADVEINDKSLLSGLMGEDAGDGGRPFYRRVLAGWRFDSKDRFPVAMLLCRTLWVLFGLFVSLFYFLASLLMMLLTGKWKERSTSPRLNAVLFVSTIIVYIVMIAGMVSFFFTNVLFFTPDNHANGAGALVVKQPCGKEHYVFLFNTAECWVNTGIDLVEGDRFTVSASGAFYGRVQDLVEKANDNERLPFDYNRPLSERADNSGVSRYCMYRVQGGSDPARFGSILCQIQPDTQPCICDYGGPDSVQGRIIQLRADSLDEGLNEFVADRSGLLHVSVNDIYLSRSNVEKMQKDANAVLKASLGIDSSFVYEQGMEERWFADNIGEILMNVVVTRNAANASLLEPEGMMQSFYNYVDECVASPSKRTGLYKFLGIVAAVLLADFGLGFLLRGLHRGKGVGRG
ncbi:MAG TPA: hypothetical protein IAA99_07700 [Candidatus Avibacteroides faecavium]|mgnify:CR=1 FL=1|nr:hypothetical protein [Candidatus Avibacteroides faecavium]